MKIEFESWKGRTAGLGSRENERVWGPWVKTGLGTREEKEKGLGTRSNVNRRGWGPKCLCESKDLGSERYRKVQAAEEGSEGPEVERLASAAYERMS